MRKKLKLSIIIKKLYKIKYFFLYIINQSYKNLIYNNF